MKAVQIVSLLSLCFVVYGSNEGRSYESDEGRSYGSGFKPILGGQKIHLDGAKIHLNAPKILLDVPKIHVIDSSNHGSLLEDEPIHLENQRPLYTRKNLRGIPILIKSSGYGERDLDIEAPVKAVRVVQRPTVIHQQAILIRRPVVVTRDLITTQDQLDKAHYDQSRYGQAGLVHGLSGLHTLQAVPVSKDVHEKTLIYENLRQGLSHGSGQGGIPLSAYKLAILTQPKDNGGQSAGGYGAGKEIYSIGNLKKY